MTLWLTERVAGVLARVPARLVDFAVVTLHWTMFLRSPSDRDAPLGTFPSICGNGCAETFAIAAHVTAAGVVNTSEVKGLRWDKGMTLGKDLRLYEVTRLSGPGYSLGIFAFPRRGLVRYSRTLRRNAPRVCKGGNVKFNASLLRPELVDQHPVVVSA